MSSKIAKIVKYGLAGVIVIGVVALLLAIVIIPLGLSINLAYFKLTGSFLGLESILASLSKEITFWLILIVFVISTIITLLSSLAKPTSSFIALTLIILSILSTFAVIEIVEILMSATDIEQATLFENILKSIIYSGGSSTIMTHLDIITDED